MVERPTGFTRLDLHGPHDLMYCAPTEYQARAHAAELARGSRDPVLGPLEGPDGVMLVEHRVGRGWCVFRYPRWELSYDCPF